MHARIRGYEGATPASEIPTPPSKTPSGMSTGNGLLSEKYPKSGWTTEELSVAASTSEPAAASDSPRPATRNGTSAATAPWFTSVNRCPADNADIARRSTPFPTAVCTRKILPAVRDVVRRERPDAGGFEVDEGDACRVHGLPHEFAGRRTAAGRRDLDVQVGRVAPYPGQVLCHFQGIAEAAEFVHEA